MKQRVWTGRTGKLAGLALRVLPLLAAGCGRLDTPDLLISGVPRPPADRPIERQPPRFVSSDACRACHPSEYESWHSSFHRTMTQEVGPDTVLAPWEGELTVDGKLYRLERRGDEFWAEMDDPEVDEASPEWKQGPPRVWRRIVMSTGSHNFQAYWFPSGKSRKLYLFVLCYRVDERRWMPMDSAFIEPPTVHRKSKVPRWNLSCAKCHTTNPRTRVRGPDEMDTDAVEFGIACEACHGPGREHVEANENPLRRYLLYQSDEPDATIVEPSKLLAARSGEVCGQCHGITMTKDEFQEFENAHGSGFEPGKQLFARRDLIREGESFFWSDGQVRVSGREYNGLERSPCFLHGNGERTMTCLSCHRMHKQDEDPRSLEEWRVYQLEPDGASDRACTQCHAQYEDPARVAQHTHHREGSTSCYDCHMPHTVWGLLKAIRSHTVGSPSAAESVTAGRPNACNLCHLDRTLAWTAETLEAWYGIPPPALDEEQRTVAASVIWSLTGDAGLRALMAWHMGWDQARAVSGEAWIAPYLATLLDDPYDAVRFRAGRSLKALEGFGGFPYDFVASLGELVRAREQAMETWKSRADTRAGLDARPLLMERGALDMSRFLDFLARRDQREMVLAE